MGHLFILKHATQTRVISQETKWNEVSATDAAVLLVKYAVACLDVLFLTFLKRLALTIIDHHAIRPATLSHNRILYWHQAIRPATLSHNRTLYWQSYLIMNTRSDPWNNYISHWHHANRYMPSETASHMTTAVSVPYCCTLIYLVIFMYVHVLYTTVLYGCGLTTCIKVMYIWLILI